jgi:DNA-binding PadR family transcriptional regulator
MTHPDDLPLTPLTMAVLLALADGDRHGYALMQDVKRQTEGTLRPGTGSLYAALDRLTDDGLIAGAPGEPGPGPGRPRKVYRITDEGRAMVRAEARRMLRVLVVARERSLAPEGLA